MKKIYFDLETTGFDCKVDRIVEFGAVIENEDGSTEEINTLVDPGFPILNSDIHHITDEMVQKDGMKYADFEEMIKNLFTGDILVIAYNIQFDSQFINEILGEFPFNMLDIMAIYKDRHSYPWKLDCLVSMYKVEVKNTHRAIDDVHAMIEGLNKMMDINNNFDKYINKIGYMSKYGVSGIRFDQCEYIAQYGGCREIERSCHE